MADLAPGAPWGSFRIERLVGRGPSGTVYRAVPSAGGAPVTLKVFHDSLAETVLLRFEDDTRRLIGLSAPNILRVDSVGREGGRRYFVTEAFDGRSLRDAGPFPAREGVEVFLKAARAIGAGWMRLILHRNLKPENILLSASGDVKVTDFGLFQEPTAVWSPERRAGQSPDMRSELYSLGTIFREFLTDRPPEIDALLDHMTRVQTYERVQMAEDVISRLESFLQKGSAPPVAPAPPPPPMPPPELVLPAIPEMPPLPMFESPIDPAPRLQEARASMVDTLGAIVDRRTLKVVPPPAPPTRPVRPPEPPPLPEFRPTPRRSALASCLMAFVILSIGSTIVITRFLAKMSRPRAVPSETRRKTEQPPVPAPKPLVTDDRARTDWIETKAAIRALEEEMRYPDAADLCDRFLRRHGGQAPSESRDLLTELRSWATLVQQAEASRKQVQGTRSLDLLDRGGPSRAKDRERILAKWCEEDWDETTKLLKEEIAQNNPYRARDLLDRFLKLPHQGGLHKQEAETRKLQLVAGMEFTDVSARVDGLVRAHKTAEAVALWEEYLAKPHKGGAQREEIEKRLAALRDAVRATIYAGGKAVSRLAVSPDGKRVALLADRIRVVDLESREEIFAQATSGVVRAMAFAGESVLVVAYPYLVVFYDLEKKAEARSIRPSNGAILALVTSRDGKRVIAARNDGALVTWEGESDVPKVEKDGSSGTTTMALSPDGKKVALAVFRDRTIRVRDLTTGEEKRWTATVAVGMALVWSPDGTRLGSYTGDTFTLWDAAGGTELHTIRGQQGGVISIAFTADGARFATGGSDKTIKLWKTSDGSAAGRLEGHAERVGCLIALPDGRLLSGSGDGTVRVWSP